MTDQSSLEPLVPPRPNLTDGTVTLRPWTPDDAPAVHAAVQDPEIPRYMEIPPNQTLEGVATWLEAAPAAWESGTSARFAIVDAHSGALLGSLGVDRSGDDPRVGEVGYWIAAEARRGGVATRAVELVVVWAFDCMGLSRIEITVHETNLASQRVAERCGFLREGVLRGYREHRGERVDLIMYARLVDDRATRPREE